MTATLTCSGRFRELTPTGETPKPWNHMVPRGEFPGTIAIPAGYDVPGYGVAQEAMEVDGLTVLGDRELESIVHRFQENMLIDPDHLSHDRDHNTEAMGWGQGIRYMLNRADGLEVETEWTPLGKEKIIHKIYRYISPEFAGSVKYADGTFKFYPSALTGAGLTNRPKLTALQPVSANRNTTKHNTMDYKSALCKSLGLDPATATDDEITAKMTARESDAATSANRETRLKVLESENKVLRGEVIAGDLARFAGVIDDVASATELLQLNRETAVKFFTAAAAKKATTADATTPIYQKNRATAPDGAKFMGDDADDEKATAKFRAISGRATQLANDAKASGKPRDWNSCWSQAEGEAG